MSASLLAPPPELSTDCSLLQPEQQQQGSVIAVRKSNRSPIAAENIELF